MHSFLKENDLDSFQFLYLNLRYSMRIVYFLLFIFQFIIARMSNPPLSPKKNTKENILMSKVDGIKREMNDTKCFDESKNTENETNKKEGKSSNKSFFGEILLLERIENFDLNVMNRNNKYLSMLRLFVD